MSKKETEFDRVARMKKMEKEASIMKRKSSVFEEVQGKKKRKPKPYVQSSLKTNFDYYDIDDEIG